MTVIDKRKSLETKFKDIQPGATFFWKGWYFLKFSKPEKENAVCLTDGLLELFEENDLVTPVKATLTIS